MLARRRGALSRLQALYTGCLQAYHDEVPAPVVSFRCSDPNLMTKLEMARATMPKQQWAEVFTWLFDHPQVLGALRELVDPTPRSPS